MYTEAIELKPDDATAYRNLGVVQARFNDFGAAIASTKKAMACNPKLADAYDYLGYFYIETGSLDSAMESFSKCLDLDNKAWNAKLGLALVYFKSNDTVNATTYLTQAREDEPRLSKGMEGIAELESVVFSYSEKIKETIRKLFDATK